MPQLRYLDNVGQLVTFDLSSTKVTVGRAETCQIIFEGDLISREHTRIEREVDGRWRVRDLGSRNKTFLNGLPISDALLAAGDIIRIGERQLEFRDGPTRLNTTLQELMTEDRADPPGTEYRKIKEVLPLPTQQIEKLSELTFQTSMIPRVEDLADVALSRLLMATNAERGFVAMKGVGKQDIDVLSARAFARQPGTDGPAISQNFVYAGLAQGLGGRYPTEAKLIAQIEGIPATAIIAPLVSNGKAVGAIYLDRPIARRPFESGAMHYLMAAGATLGAAMTQSHRRLGAMQRQSSAANLAVLRRMQADINPPISVGEAFTYSGRILHGHARCGDLRDIIALHDKIIVLTLDTGGTGTTGFVYAASIMAAMRAVVEHDPDHIDIEGCFNSVNRSLAGRKTRQVVACCAVLIDLSNSSLTYVNAGTPPPIMLIAPGRSLPLDRSSLLLGVEANHVYEHTTIELPDAFRLVTYSDGLTEAVNLDGNPFGEQALQDIVLDREAFATPSLIVEAAIKKLTEHMARKPIEDDAPIQVITRG